MKKILTIIFSASTVGFASGLYDDNSYSSKV